MLTRDSRISELEAANNNLKNEVELYKKKNPNAADANIQRYQKQIEEMEHKHKKVVEDYQKRVNDLENDLASLKKSRPIDSSSSITVNEDEIAKLSLENESLRKQLKDYQSGKNVARLSDTHIEDLRNQILDLETDKKKLENEVSKLRVLTELFV